MANRETNVRENYSPLSYLKHGRFPLMTKVELDDPRTWKKYRAELCRACHADCCTMPVEVRAYDIVRLGLADEIEIQDRERKVANQLIKDGVIKSYREKTGLFTLTQKSNGDCFYLDKNRLCTVYEKRPEVCRKFPLTMSRRPGYCPATTKIL